MRLAGPHGRLACLVPWGGCAGAGCYPGSDSLGGPAGGSRGGLTGGRSGGECDSGCLRAYPSGLCEWAACSAR